MARAAVFASPRTSKKRLIVGASALMLLSVLLSAAWYVRGGANGTINGVPRTGLTPTSHQLADTFSAASSSSGVPASLLAAICFLEGGMSMHNGEPSEDNGYGCMHLTQNSTHSTLTQAARDLGTTPGELKGDMGANIAGGAALLRDHIAGHPTPESLGEWYGAVAAYSGAATRSAAKMYADAVYRLLQEGFTARLDDGQVFTQRAIAVRPDVNTLAAYVSSTSSSLPSGCTNDANVDYKDSNGNPLAVDCILPTSFDCNPKPTNYDCSYNGANRPTDLAINHVVIHDAEGTGQQTVSYFLTPSSDASAHYVVDTDGTVYQIVHEKDISYEAGNWWYNEHAVGIEHAGYDASGYSWYNASEYLASAKLVAYLLKKYTIPLDHAHVVAHGTIPSPTLGTSPNHVDPGPYWLWDYYFSLISQQGVSEVGMVFRPNVVTLRPATDQSPSGSNGAETSANFNFFNLHSGPSPKATLIPYLGPSSDITNETFDIEPDMSYYYLTRRPDPGRSGDWMYLIWYGVSDQGNSNYYWADGRLTWLVVPHSAVAESACETSVCNVVQFIGTPGATANIYGRPTSSASDIIGATPVGSQYVSMMTASEDTGDPKPGTLWYEINFNHRQAWVPASEVTVS